jgi:hypothetical protein
LTITNEMYGKFLFLHMVKKYNFFQGVDVFFRELGKVLLELKNDGLVQPAGFYQDVLNTTFFVKETQKQEFEVRICV